VSRSQFRVFAWPMLVASGLATMVAGPPVPGSRASVTRTRRSPPGRRDTTRRPDPEPTPAGPSDRRSAPPSPPVRPPRTPDTLRPAQTPPPRQGTATRWRVAPAARRTPPRRDQTQATGIRHRRAAGHGARPHSRSALSAAGVMHVVVQSRSIVAPCWHPRSIGPWVAWAAGRAESLRGAARAGDGVSGDRSSGSRCCGSATTRAA
jgi:hypothetical protein